MEWKIYKNTNLQLYENNSFEFISIAYKYIKNKNSLSLRRHCHNICRKVVKAAEKKVAETLQLLTKGAKRKFNLFRQ